MDENKQYLYRYRHLNGEHREWTKRIITDYILYFASPSTFNDPFDCRVHYLSSFDTDEFRRQHIKRLKERIPDLNRKGRRAKATEDMKILKPEEFIVQVTNGLQKDLDQVGVLSLSASERNILLWSHYAAGHTGLCLKFIATNQTPFFGSALPVNYDPTYPEICVTSSMGEQIDAFLLTKAKDWEYEREYRIIDHDNGPGEKTFPSEFLVGLIFGARMTPDDKKIVASWVNKSDNHVELFEASLSTGAFSLEIQRYES